MKKSKEQRLASLQQAAERVKVRRREQAREADDVFEQQYHAHRAVEAELFAEQPELAMNLRQRRKDLWS